jgi:hypothetical protein
VGSRNVVWRGGAAVRWCGPCSIDDSACCGRMQPEKTTRGASQWRAEHVRESTMAWTSTSDRQSKRGSKESKQRAFWQRAVGRRRFRGGGGWDVTLMLVRLANHRPRDRRARGKRWGEGRAGTAQDRAGPADKRQTDDRQTDRQTDGTVDRWTDTGNRRDVQRQER